jgi:hypothetical protein
VPISFILIAGALYSLFNNFRDSVLALAGIKHVAPSKSESGSHYGFREPQQKYRRRRWNLCASEALTEDFYASHSATLRFWSSRVVGSFAPQRGLRGGAEF